MEKEEETSTLFRSATLTTALMDLYMRSVCTEFLSTAIFPTIHRILEASARGGQSCELNPSKIESAAEACANAEFLLQVLDDITESIFMSSEACPRTLRCGRLPIWFILEYNESNFISLASLSVNIVLLPWLCNLWHLSWVDGT